MPVLRSLAPNDHDIEQVLDLNAAALPAVATLDRPELVRLMALSPEHLAIESNADSVIGYALIFTSDADYDGEEFHRLRQRLAAPFLYIDQIVIDESARGKGLGRAVYDRLAQRAQQGGMNFLACEVNTQPANPASLAFHRRLGFADLAPMATRDGREVVLLARRLDADLRR